MHIDASVIEVTDFKSLVRSDNLEINIGKNPLQVMRGSPLVSTEGTSICGKKKHYGVRGAARETCIRERVRDQSPISWSGKLKLSSDII